MTCTDQRECFLLFDCTVRDGTQDLRIKPRESCQLLGICLVALAITMRYGSQLAHVRYDDLMPQLLELLADPDRVRPRLHGYSCRRHIRKPLLDSLRTSSEAASVDHYPFFVERAVMAPDISKVDANRHPDLALSAWNFCYEVLR